MLGDAKVDEDGNVYDAKDGNLIYFDKDGEDREINISSAICFLRGKAYGALQNRIKLLSRLIRCAMRRWNALLKVICSHLKKYDKESTVEARFKKLENEISGCVSGSSMISTLVNNTDLLACKAEYYHQCSAISHYHKALWLKPDDQFCTEMLNVALLDECQNGLDSTVELC
ncbi:hypothetical protein F2Q69_00010140 [Brassica cretica]|uniref:Uncharacterized protein n=1 Tax=Brassica cretica TaxID=69181 RepID=A0A8S9NZH1_BRACR|nr:hypothetical protein F2Q69_00010140 [Brassica cretica]